MKAWSVNFLIFFLPLVVGYSALAKGTGDLAPTPPPEAAPAAEEDAPAEPSKMDQTLDGYTKDRLSLHAGFGHIIAFKGGASWHASGSADITAQYNLNRSWKDGTWFAHGRYLAFDGAPDATDGGDYAGAIASLGCLLAGASWQKPIKDRINAYGMAELGLVFATFQPMLEGDKVAKAKENGLMVNFGGGAHYAFLEKFLFGPKFILGAGYVTTVNLGIDFSFLF